MIIQVQKEVVDACEKLMGNNTYITPEFLEILTPSGVTTAYRKLLKSVHPDKCTEKNKDPYEMTLRYHELAEAYELLLQFINRKEMIFSRNAP